ncbi:unnamed protein product [Kuraishia capsulata CBS 1993]|uniref:Uncharacterized protein n=1 Tax=Kuraishia capsulata CBS 1993 TaxID=1382522 RepID=W6MX68_9ASCO|nr:uncharacterized protein KUCA_T00004347001 [Kuraishia capsulata CBS 1993]CDK28365.1 unnamed protein product [Kuraishia capsulata CBS 1993]
MPPRAYGRNRNGVKARKNGAAESSGSGSGAGKGKSIPGTPSTMLMQILDELDLTFDSSLGQLQGDSIINAPSDSVLSSIQRTLEKLIARLDITIASDSDVLSAIDELSEPKSKTKAPPSPPQVSRGLPGRRGRQRSRSKAISAEDEKNRSDSEAETKESVDKAVHSASEDEDSRPPKRRKRGETVEAESPSEPKSETELADVKAEEDEDGEEDDEDVENPGEDDDNDNDESVADAENNDSVVSEADAVPKDEARTEVADNFKKEVNVAEVLPDAISVLGLYVEEEPEDPELVDDEFKKRKYGVAVFPHRDLKDMLPGQIPDIDFSKNKPPNQIPFTTFQSYIEPYFRPYTDEDIKLLKTRVNLPSTLPKDYDDRLTPFIIPKMGPFYGDVWAEEDSANSGTGVPKPAGGATAQAMALQNEHSRNLVAPKGSAQDLTDETLETEDISCGPLASRLLSAILQEEDLNDDIKSDPDDEDQGEDSPGWKSTASAPDYSSLEQRLKRELKYIGVYMNVEQTLRAKNGAENGSLKKNGEFQEDWLNGREDDEICVELRKLQRELKTVTKRNQKRKESLIPIVEEQIAWQEYMSILEDLDKQVEQAYRRRITVPLKKAKKRGPGAIAHVAMTRQSEALSAQQQAANSGFRALLDKRAKWIEKIGPLFREQQDMRRMPTESVFGGVDLSGENDDDDLEENGADETIMGNGTGNGGVNDEAIPELQ